MHKSRELLIISVTLALCLLAKDVQILIIALIVSTIGYVTFSFGEFARGFLSEIMKKEEKSYYQKRQEILDRFARREAWKEANKGQYWKAH